MTAEARIQVQVRLAGLPERAAVIALLQAMDTHYHPERQPCTAADAAALLDRIAADGALGTSFAVAFADGEPAGLVAFTVLHPGVQLKGLLFIKDLFVEARFRNAGIGEAILRFLAGFARERGIGRIDLTTEPDNAGAQRFYERLGFATLPKVFYRLDGESLARLAEEG